MGRVYRGRPSRVAAEELTERRREEYLEPAVFS